MNYDAPVLSAATPSTPEAYLDYFVADSPVDCHRDHLLVGSQQVKVLSMKEPPGQTFAHILGDLLAVPGEFIACLEWQRAGQDRMRREIQSRRRHFFNKRVSLINYVSPEAKAEEMLVDESATATVKQLGDALTEMEVQRARVRSLLLDGRAAQRGPARPGPASGPGHEGAGRP